jgi:hypothetical protein
MRGNESSINENDAPIHKNVDDIVAVMKELQLTLQWRHEVIMGILTPIDMTTIATTMSKLKSALVEITTLNSQLVMRNNKLARELSFMPPSMRQKLVQAKNQRSKIYLEQRTNPHHLIPDTVKKVELCFVPADMSDPNVAKLQRDETVTSIHELLAEVEDVMCMTGLKFDMPIEVDNNLGQYEDGEIPPGKSDLPPAPKARNINSVNADEGTNMRSHANFMHKGHWVHPYRDPTLTYEEPPALFPNKIIGGNDEERANKRSHESEVPTRHKMHPSKVPRKEPSDKSDQSSVADLSDDMNQSSSASNYDSAYYAPVAQGAKVYRKPSLHPSQEVETNPYSPIQRGLVEYDITRDDRVSTKDPPMPRSWTNKGGKGKGKTNAKGWNARKGKGGQAPEWIEAFSQIPAFGSSEKKILLFNIKDFYEDHNPYSVQPARAHECSTEPGQLIRSPSDSFVRCRFPMSQSYDQTVHRAYFKAQSILQGNGCPVPSRNVN